MCIRRTLIRGASLILLLCMKYVNVLSTGFKDRVLRETADKRNELESYVYAMRDKLIGSLRPYVEGEEAENFSNRLTAAEDW